MSRVYNFSAGPAALPEEVLQQAARELVEYPGTGMSVMEMSHRSDEYTKIFYGAQKALRELMNIPDNYEILFLQGGASLQFAMVPLNLMSKHRRAGYTDTDEWAKKAIQQAKKYGEVVDLGSSADKNYSYLPATNWAKLPQDLDYVHITSNNTIFGTCYHQWPNTGSIPLVLDMSSNILSDVVDVSKSALIYAGAQKNIGPSGVVVVIVRKDLLGKAMDITPIMLDYNVHVQAESMYNTPACYGVYMAGLVFEWLKKQGGVEVMAQKNKEKAELLYKTIDESSFFRAPVTNKAERSWMNVPFVTPSEDLDKKFIKEAAAAGFVNLKGHRVIGGMRASIYNAMPKAGVEKLAQFMADFAKKYR